MDSGFGEMAVDLLAGVFTAHLSGVNFDEVLEKELF